MKGLVEWVFRFIFVSLIVISVIAAANGMSAQLSYAPSTVLMYFFVGAVIAYTSSVIFDRRVLRKPGMDEAEIEALKQLLLENTTVTESDIRRRIRKLRQDTKSRLDE